ncbi:MAG: succinate dehydrogenase cytochrome b subunit [Candidatus Omnitrophica bacterium]|nr:succinate dehydrogenase cytochrome b subunit [Candidatus Omnitrophota bacterium]
MSYQTFDFNSSITKKQIVALTGLVLIFFVVFHLAGNLFIYGGPAAFNGYVEKLDDLGVLKTIAEWGLFFVFGIHILTTAFLVLENIQARGISRYAVDNSKGPRSLATRLMPYSGSYLFLYVIWHLIDFSWADQQGPRSIIHGVSYGLYGVVVNAFKDPLHSMLYIIAMCFLGLHLAHGTQSFLQTFGFNDNRFTPCIKKFSRYFAVAMAAGYSSIPLYVLYVLKV